MACELECERCLIAHQSRCQEWEEKLNQSNDRAELYKSKYERLKDQQRGENYMEQARSFAAQMSTDSDAGGILSTPMRASRSAAGSSGTTPRRPGSVASNMSGLAQHARSLVTSMNCASMTSSTTDNNNNHTPTSAVASPIHSVGGGKKSSSRVLATPPQRMDV